MKNAFIFLSLFATLRCGQPHSQKAPAIKNGNDYECVLMDTHHAHGNCGIRQVAVGMRFKLISEERWLAIVIRCPGSFEEGFWSNDQKYTVTLTSDSSICEGYKVYNDYKDSLPTYFALNIIKSD